MELIAKFDIGYMEPALAFLESLPEKVKDKIAYNLSKSRYFMDSELLKSSMTTFGSSAQNIKA